MDSLLVEITFLFVIFQIKIFETLMHQIPGDIKTKISAIKIMSQYNAQCSAIRNALDLKKYKDVNVDTVVACQGKFSIAC